MRALVPVLLSMLAFGPTGHAQQIHIADAYPDKARYTPGESIGIDVEVSGIPQPGAHLRATLWDLRSEVSHCEAIVPAAQSHSTIRLSCSAPPEDHRGYLAAISLRSASGLELARAQTAVDISSDWSRFPRYGYIAHYNQREGADPVHWIEQLNRFHIDVLQFYDFQYRHDQPLAGTVNSPAPSWHDIAGRVIEQGVVMNFIQDAHAHNMAAMAYNSSYSAFDDAFSREKDPLPLTWATWSDSAAPRTAATAKSFDLRAPGWSTSKLFFMNQNDPGWQGYLFGQMAQLFRVYPFDGWHIDTFGERKAFAYDGTPVDYIAGFKRFINHAADSLDKPVVFNAVNTWGQDQIAQSAAAFVYSELWEDHETFASLLNTVEQVRLAKPGKAFVIAAYVNRRDSKIGSPPFQGDFNTPAVLLTDAAIFSLGAAHIELGDGDRMLSSEYFPDDVRLRVSTPLQQKLRHYYDFLTAYELYLRDAPAAGNESIEVAGFQSDPLAVPGTLWTIVRKRENTTMIHLINLLGSDDPHWRDPTASRPEPPQLQALKVSVGTTYPIVGVGWASPDSDGGQYHSLPFATKRVNGQTLISFTLPRLSYWDMIVLSQAASPSTKRLAPAPRK